MNSVLLFGLALLGWSGEDSFRNDGAWRGLDREIEALAASLNTSVGGELGGFLQARLRWEDEADTLGFDVQNARVDYRAEVGDYRVRIETNFRSMDGGGEYELFTEELVLSTRCGEYLEFSLGRLENPFSREFDRYDDDDLLFLERALLVEPYADREEGVRLRGNGERFDWLLAVLNGSDGVGDEYRVGGRIDVQLGDDPLPGWQGAYASGPDVLNIGLGYTEDFGLDEHEAVTLDGTLMRDGWSLDGQVFDNGAALGDNTPWLVYGSLLFAEDWEAAGRYTAFDDGQGTCQIDAGVLWRPEQNRDVTWRFMVGRRHSDEALLEETWIGVGTTLRFNRPNLYD